MHCSECGAENRPGRKYCSRCGGRLDVVCPSCGTVNQAGDAFCGECGTALEPSLPPADSAPPETARRFVTVLFADLVGFTPFSERRDPEEVREFLIGYFAAAREIVERFGGVVDKFIGDALMAVWGAVAAQEDDAERAVRAGLELADGVRRRGSEMGIPDLTLRVGVLTGEAAVGPGGNERGLVVGDLVNTAARLQAAAPPGAVVVGEATYRATRSAIAFESLGPQALKGKESPVPAWRAVGVAGLRRGLQRADLIEPPFVDRDEELRLLKDALHATGREQRARLLSVLGIAGVGKTRLAWEFEKYIDGIAEPIYWHLGRSPAYGEGMALHALAEMVRRRAAIPEDAPADAASRALGIMLDRYVPDARERRWLEPRLGGLLGLEEVPPGDRGELFSALRSLFERVAQHGTTVLVFEDLHLADTGLLDFIEEIPEWSRDHPILVITLARPEILERRPGWGAGRHGGLAVHLRPLPSTDMARLIEGLAPGIPPEVAGLVLEAAAGVPLYAVELVRMLLDDGRLTEEEGRFRLTGDLTGLAVPESLQAVIGARLDRLDGAARDLIGDAAVLGRSFSVDALAAVADGEAALLPDRLADLCRREILELDRDPSLPEPGRYRFIQSLIREVAYARLNRAKRHDRHRRAARYFESRSGSEAAGAAAEHYLAARAHAGLGPEAQELSRRAVAALQSAAERAAALHSPEQALSYCRQALQAAPEADNTPALLELAAESAAALARADEAEHLARQLVAWHIENQNRGAELRAVRLLGRITIERQDPAGAVLLLAEALRFADEGKYPAEVAEVREALARAYMLAGRLEDAVVTANTSLEVAERHGNTPVIAQALITKGTVLGDLGRRREGTALLEGALDLATAHDLPTTELRARMNLSHLLWDDDPAGQLPNLRAGMELARRLGNRRWATLFVGNLFDVLRATGDFDGALALFSGIDLAGLDPAQQANLRLIRMSVLQYRQDAATARREIDHLASLATADSDPQGRYYALLFRAGAAALAGDHEAAWSLSLQAGNDNPMGLNQWLFPAGDAAIARRDARRVSEVLASFDHSRPTGRVYRAWRIELVAAGEALAGRTRPAVTGLEEARDLWQNLGLTLFVAQNRLHLVRLCPEEPEAAAAAEEALRLAERMGAPTLVAGRLHPGGESPA